MLFRHSNLNAFVTATNEKPGFKAKARDVIARDADMLWDSPPLTVAFWGMKMML
jgi:hypothetical protein